MEKIEKSNASYQAQASIRKEWCSNLGISFGSIWEKSVFLLKARVSWCQGLMVLLRSLKGWMIMVTRVICPKTMVSAIFNVVYLSSFLDEDHLANLRASCPQQGKDDGGPPIKWSLAHQTAKED